MSEMHTLDILIVYSANKVVSSSRLESEDTHPFLMGTKAANYNPAYAYFLHHCAAVGIRAGFTSSADITGPGTCNSYWAIGSDGITWKKVNSPAQSHQIFDKFSPISAERIAERDLIFSDPTIQPFNDQNLLLTFFDKLHTYQQFPHYAIPTVEIPSSSRADIASALKNLKTLIRNHPQPEDFTSQVILKDRFGSSGEYVYKVEGNNQEKQIQDLLLNAPGIVFILQPFVLFDFGYSYQGIPTPTDIRLIFHHDRILQSYIRMAKENEFRCNEHQGGKLVYVTLKDIPDQVQLAAQTIVAQIKKPQSLYALDFIVSNSGKAHFLEGNIGPGLDWDPDNKINKEMSHQLIHSIVAEMSLRVQAESFPILKRVGLKLGVSAAGTIS